MKINTNAIQELIKYLGKQKDGRAHICGIHIKSQGDLMVYTATNATIMLRIVEPRIIKDEEIWPENKEVILVPIKEKLSFPKWIHEIDHYAELKNTQNNEYRFDFHKDSKDAYIFYDISGDYQFPNADCLIPGPEDLVPVAHYGAISPKILAVVETLVGGRIPFTRADYMCCKDDEFPTVGVYLWQGNYMNNGGKYLAVAMCRRPDSVSYKFTREELGCKPTEVKEEKNDDADA